MKKKLISCREATRFFYDNAMFMSCEDVIPNEVVISALGEDALRFAHYMNRPPHKEVLVRAYGIGHHTESALNMKGFFVAVTHYNISTLLEARKERESEGDDED